MLKHRRSHGLQLASLLLALAGAGCAASSDGDPSTGGTGGDSSGSAGASGAGGGTGASAPAVDLVSVPARHNYFADRGHSDAETKQRIDDAWASLYAGDPETEAVYFTAGSNGNGALAYILDYGNGDVRSEGMSYGMMIAVQTGHKAEFDAMWNWAVTYMYHADPAHPAHGYFAWQLKPDGKEMDPMPAADGEEYFAAALLFAASRWGSGTGIYDVRGV
jgi:oligosaccharide reducing-end xylanase